MHQNKTLLSTFTIFLPFFDLHVEADHIKYPKDDRHVFSSKLTQPPVTCRVLLSHGCSDTSFLFMLKANLMPYAIGNGDSPIYYMTMCMHVSCYRHLQHFPY